MITLITILGFLVFFILTCIAGHFQWTIWPLFLIIMIILFIGTIISLNWEKKEFKKEFKKDPSILLKL